MDKREFLNINKYSFININQFIVSCIFIIILLANNISAYEAVIKKSLLNTSTANVMRDHFDYMQSPIEFNQLTNGIIL